MENNKGVIEKKQCDIHVVSSSNKFLIRQISKKEFIILKLFKKEITQGYLWWKKTIIIEEYKRVTKYGNKMVCRLGFSNVMDCVKYKSKKKAEKWIANYNKYPIDYYC